MSRTIERLDGAERLGPRVAQATGARRRLLAGVPLTERRLELAGVSTSVLEGGGGPPLVLLHGGIECGGVYWAPIVSTLAQSHRLVVPDLPGLGESDPVSRLDDAVFGAWLSALLELTCSERPVLVAHSLGGPLASRFAASRGDLVRSLVLYGVPGLGRYRLPVGLMAAAVRLDLRPTQRNLERFERWAFLDPERTKRRAPEWFEAFDAYTLSRGRVRHVKRTMRRLIRRGTTAIPEAVLRRIEIPTSLLWGRGDRMVPLSLFAGTSDRLGWPLRVIDDVGHVPHLEQPDTFVEVLRTLLDRS